MSIDTRSVRPERAPITFPPREKRCPAPGCDDRRFWTFAPNQVCCSERCRKAWRKSLARKAAK